MNPHSSRSLTPYAMARSFYDHRKLIFALIKRDVIGRYRGSAMGILWSLFNPILMLAVYTFVFSVIFKARWPGGSESKTEFALVLFSGLMVFSLFSECITRAPGIILANVNYVKKVIFPLEILTWVMLGAALFHLLVSFTVWVVFYLLFFGMPSATVIWLPVLLMPLLFMIMGLSWLFSSLGVYLRDVSQIVGVAVSVLMFLSPIFYPVEILPPAFQPYMQISPLTFVVEQAREILIWKNTMDWAGWGAYTAVSLLVSWLGFAWFQKTRKGFADVL